jgi:magnesium-protoporphyrin IX monomethyl ester (oxidative) cyclase
VLNVDHPKFYVRLERLVTNNEALASVDQSPSPAPIKALRKLPYWTANALVMAKLFLMKPIRSEAFQPAVR